MKFARLKLPDPQIPKLGELSCTVKRHTRLRVETKALWLSGVVITFAGRLFNS